MKKIDEKARVRELTRRDFVGGALTAAGAIAGAPAFFAVRTSTIVCGLPSSPAAAARSPA